ncbi:hypothetical protein [Negadavirga shengliensis]|uniref:Dolichyl-phosphate-mannose-protein mannosyltransferase n=1 Tax=Negadavirga shengliensis TaxID=1389218 RepID=A0ABV9T1J3_9BACT
MDFIILALVLGGVTWSNHRLAKKQHFSTFSIWSLQGLWVYHLLFSWIFYRFIVLYGGDAQSYWALTADTSRTGDTWMAHWGLGTFFIQWLNYLPAGILGIGFLTGNLLYAALSFIGFRELLCMVRDSSVTFGKSWREKAWVLLLFTPNVHFWTAGIGKEALLWLGLVWVLKGFIQFPRNWIYLSAGILLTFLTRPFSSLIVLTVLLVVLPFQNIFRPYRKWAVMTSALLLLSIAAYKWFQGYTQFGFSSSWVTAMFQEQMAFLRTFNAGSEVPMETYSFPEKLWTVWFRPIWEHEGGIWFLAASLENSFALLLFSLGIWGLIFRKRKTVPLFLIAGSAVGILMCLLYAFTLNNLGIMMRMKSIYMIIFYMTAYFLFLSEGGTKRKGVMR